jgi:hypothetical protein
MVGGLDLEEAVTVLHSACRGFHTIEYLFGGVEPREELIGVNEEGKTKVWLNERLQVNFSDKRGERGDVSNQFVKVAKLLRIV